MLGPPDQPASGRKRANPTALGDHKDAPHYARCQPTRTNSQTVSPVLAWYSQMVAAFSNTSGSFSCRPGREHEHRLGADCRLWLHAGHICGLPLPGHRRDERAVGLSSKRRCHDS